MSAYDNDSRVRRHNTYLFFVEAPDDRYSVAANQHEHDWWATNMIGGTSYRAAGLRNREDAEAWAKRTARGPFYSADEAIRELIGEPR